MKGIAMFAPKYVSGNPHIRRTVSVGVDGSQLIRTCTWADGEEYDIRFNYTAPTMTQSMNLLSFTEPRR